MQLPKLLRNFPWQVVRTAVLAVALVTVVFPDVVAGVSTFRMTDQQWAVWRNASPTQAYPVPGHLSWYTSGLTDPGGALFQSEPMMEFMRHNVATLDSPYWNPYSAAGSLGPETMVDLKFSAFTLAYAVLGGGTFVYDLLTLFGYWLGVFFVLRICEQQMRLSVIPALAAGIFYLLNGFAAANVASNVAQSYFLVPLCIYTAFAFIEKSSLARFARMSAAFAVFLSFTFAPTTIAQFAAISTCAIAFAVSRVEYDAKRWLAVGLRTFLGLLAGGITAVLALAVIYFPLLENTASTGILEAYGQRIFYPASAVALLSLFTPSHFFESYRAATPEALAFSKNTIFHFGVVGIALAASSVSSTKRYWLHPMVLLLAAFALLVLARVFGAPVLTDVVDRIPLLGKLGEQYIWAAVAVVFTLLVPIGTQNLLDGTARRWPVVLMMAAGAISAYLIYTQFGLGEPNLLFKVSALSATFFIAVLVLIVVGLSRRIGKYRVVAVCLLVAVLGTELVLDAKEFRFAPHDIYREPSSEVVFLEKNAGNYRTMTLGPYATAFEGGSAYQIQEVTSLNPGSLAGYVDYFMKMTAGVPAASRFGDFLSLAMPQPIQSLDYYSWHMVDLLGVKYIVLPSTYTGYLAAFADEGFPVVHVSEFTTVVENPNVFPRAFFVATSAVDGDVTLPDNLQPADVTPLQITSYRNASLGIEGVVAEPGLVILTDNWHPTWKATVNGKDAPIIRVNGIFRGIEVPAGPVSIQMSYSPKTLPLAIAVSAVVWIALVLLGLGAAPRRRDRRVSHRQSDVGTRRSRE